MLVPPNYAALRAFLDKTPPDVRAASAALDGHRTFTACGRPTKAGTPCRHQTERLMSACRQHATADDRQAAADERARLTAIVNSWERPVEDPACWSWPVTADDRRTVAELPTGPREIDVTRAATALIWQWQQHCCAVCAIRGNLVVDHDHATALIRGILCQSCNGREPNAEAEFTRYRERPPAVMLGVSVRYEHPFYGLVEPHDESLPLDRDPSFLVAAALAR